MLGLLGRSSWARRPGLLCLPTESSWRSVSRSGGPARLGVWTRRVRGVAGALAAWPAAVVAAVVVLCHPLVGWLAVPPRRVKVGPAGSRPNGLNKRPEW